MTASSGLGPTTSWRKALVGPALLCACLFVVYNVVCWVVVSWWFMAGVSGVLATSGPSSSAPPPANRIVALAFASYILVSPMVLLGATASCALGWMRFLGGRATTGWLVGAVVLQGIPWVHAAVVVVFVVALMTSGVLR